MVKYYCKSLEIIKKEVLNSKNKNENINFKTLIFSRYGNFFNINIVFSVKGYLRKNGGEILFTDEQLVLKVLNSERDAFDILVKKYQGLIYNYIFKITLSKEDSEDITQEVFIKAYKNYISLKIKKSFIVGYLK